MQCIENLKTTHPIKQDCFLNRDLGFVIRVWIKVKIEGLVKMDVLSYVRIE